MKTCPLVVVSLSIALAQAAIAQDRDAAAVQVQPKSRPKAAPNSQQAAPRVAPKPPLRNGPPAAVAGPKVNRWQSPNQPINQANAAANVARIRPDADMPKSGRWQQPAVGQPGTQGEARYGRANPDMPRTINKLPPATGITRPEVEVRNRDLENVRSRSGTANNAEWRTRRYYNDSWADTCRRHRRELHHRDWWRSHFTRFCLFGTGYYFWDAGYWYPAYGYDLAHNVYYYEEPIASYGDLEPAQVIASVQTELQKLGYYPYEVDGEMGPATREALANYQSDYGLEVTSAIDEPTLDSLGLL